MISTWLAGISQSAKLSVCNNIYHFMIIVFMYQHLTRLALVKYFRASPANLATPDSFYSKLNTALPVSAACELLCFPSQMVLRLRRITKEP